MPSWKDDVWLLVTEHVTRGEKFTLSWLYGFHPNGAKARTLSVMDA